MVLTPINRSLRIKITLAIVLPLILILGLFTAIEYNRHRRVVLSNLSILAGQSGRVVEANLRHAMLQTDFDEVQIVLDTLEQSEVFEVVYLLDPSGEIIFSANQGAVGTQLSNSHPDCQPCHSLPASERPQSVVVEPADSQRQVFRSMQPILNQEECTECHDASQRILGLLLTDISMEPMEAALQADLRENAVWWGISIFTTMMIVNFIINQFVLNDNFQTGVNNE